jgi:uncharacterized membrane protein YeaQ/YmgE (transglycosylase-associated protein family)
MITNLIGWCLFGLIAGAIARLLTPGKDPMGCFATIALGVVGSVLGGFLTSMILGGDHSRFEPAGFIGAVIGGVIVLMLVRRFMKSQTDRIDP